MTGEGYYDGGVICTLTATANTGYSFINWTKDGMGISNSEMYNFYVAGDASFVANFIQGTNITFADANVKTICVTNWDTDGDGELSYAEAAAVTTFGTVFKNKSNITNFNELQYFTGLTSIPNEAFRGCNGLISIKIPNSLKSIGNFAFYYCGGLTSIEIPNSVTSIGNSAFQFCSGLTSIEIPNFVTSIGNSVFSGCDGLTSIEIPNSVTSIGVYAFENCSSLTSIEIPNSVTSIGYSAFSGCSGLTSIEIPNSVTSIGDNIFQFCSGLTFVEIPNSVTSIGNSAFQYCGGLTSIEIPNAVTSIGSSAFSDCSGLTSVIVLADNPPTVGYNAFDNVNKRIPVYVPCGSEDVYTASNWCDFSNFVGLCGGEITVTSNPTEGGTVTGWGYYESGTTFTITATANPGYSFINWTKNGVWVSNSETFSFFVAGDVSYVAHFAQGTTITFADANVKARCVAKWDTDGDGELSYVEAAAVNDLGTVFQYRNITSFDELQYFVGLTSIGYEAFYYCTSLTSIEIPNTVTSIEDRAFYYCRNLTSIEIPNSVTSIGSSAFSDSEFRYLNRQLCVFWLRRLDLDRDSEFRDLNRQLCVFWLRRLDLHRDSEFRDLNRQLCV